MAFGLVPVLITQAPLMVLLWAALVVVVCAVDLMLAARPRSLQISRNLPLQVRLSQTVESELIIRNTDDRQARGRIRDGWEPSAGAEGVEAPVSLAPGAAMRMKVRLTPTRRGERRSLFVTVRLFGPLGFAARQYTFDGSASVRVLPEFKARKHLPSRIARLRELDGESAVQIRSAGTEFDSLRPYVEGDDVRSIDWRATARSQEVTLRTWRPERDRRVYVIMDTSRTSAPRIGDEPRLDTFIESALLLGALCSKAGDKVEFIAFDRVVRARTAPQSADTAIRELGTAMSGVESVLVETDWDALSALIRSRAKQRSLVVFLSNASLAQADIGALTALSALARDHLVIKASVTDPEVTLMSTYRENSVAVYDAAAAEKTLFDESAGASLLSRSGVVVLSELPEDLPPKLSDKYIELKAAGRL